MLAPLVIFLAVQQPDATELRLFADQSHVVAGETLDLLVETRVDTAAYGFRGDWTLHLTHELGETRTFPPPRPVCGIGDPVPPGGGGSRALPPPRHVFHRAKSLATAELTPGSWSLLATVDSSPSELVSNTLHFRIAAPRSDDELEERRALRARMKSDAGLFGLAFPGGPAPPGRPAPGLPEPDWPALWDYVAVEAWNPWLDDLALDAILSWRSHVPRAELETQLRRARDLFPDSTASRRIAVELGS